MPLPREIVRKSRNWLLSPRRHFLVTRPVGTTDKLGGNITIRSLLAASPATIGQSASVSFR
jgi:hypothetical protein